MPRSNSDSFGDVAATPPTPTPVPSETVQLRKRNLNATGLPNGIRDHEREVEHEVMNGDSTKEGKEDEDANGSDDSGEKVEGDDGYKESSRDDGLSLGQRLRSPLGSTLNLEELRSQISQGVEVKSVLLVAVLVQARRESVRRC